MKTGYQPDGQQLVEQLRLWALELGFSQIGVSPVDLASAEPGLSAWLAAGWHGSMGYMAAHGLKRARPAELVPGTLSVITAGMDYLPRHTPPDWPAHEDQRAADPAQAVVSVYARGRDYHKVLRARLQTLADRLAQTIGPLGHRVFCDSAPVMEVELAVRSQLAWRGKHTLALHRDAGSMFFLGELFVDLALPSSPTQRLAPPASASKPAPEWAPMPGSAPNDASPAQVQAQGQCGSCQACITACPTGAIVAPYRLDARRCISYLTIEHAGPIPLEFRRAIGNRIYGCDDCQRVCPWNKYARLSTLPDFDARHGLEQATLLELWAWSEADFDQRSQGSAIRRIGYARWRRNLAVGLGNALRSTQDPAVAAALRAGRDAADALVQEHIDWALNTD